MTFLTEGMMVLPLSVWYVALRIDEPSCPRGTGGSRRSREQSS